MMGAEQKTLGLVGAGAFGAFILPHLAPHFRVSVHDSARDVAALAAQHDAVAADLKAIAGCDVIILATPVRQMEDVARTLAPHMKAGQLVMDVGSVKLLPTRMLAEVMPEGVAVIGLHPLFGPQSGKNGIKGLNITVCPVRGDCAPKVRAFLENTLGLHVIETSAAQHDKELAYVQGLTHLIGKVFVGMHLPDFQQTTRTYELLKQMVEMVRYDSDELFRTIERDNPFAAEAKAEFFAAVAELEKKLG